MSQPSGQDNHDQVAVAGHLSKWAWFRFTWYTIHGSYSFLKPGYFSFPGEVLVTEMGGERHWSEELMVGAGE